VTRFCAWFCFFWLVALHCPAVENSFQDLLDRSAAAAQRGDLDRAIELDSAAEKIAATNSSQLCVLTKHYCDLMYSTESAAAKKSLAQHALACARQAEEVDHKNPAAHLCVAVSLVKNFPNASNQTKVNWSRDIKKECETALELNPSEDIAYYLLARWNYAVANRSFIVKTLVKVAYGGLPSASNMEAVKDLNKAIALAPNRIIHHAELAKVYETLGEHSMARVELEKCRSLKPIDRDDTEAQQEAGRQLLKFGK
jgi:tetratricopeptide (TPR) repeat protein